MCGSNNSYTSGASNQDHIQIMSACQSTDLDNIRHCTSDAAFQPFVVRDNIGARRAGEVVPPRAAGCETEGLGGGWATSREEDPRRPIPPRTCPTSLIGEWLLLVGAARVCRDSVSGCRPFDLPLALACPDDCALDSIPV